MSPRPLRALLFQPFERFFRLEAAGGLVLLAATVGALVWANSPGGGAYFGLWSTKAIVGVGGFAIDKALLLWINDGLMAIFFLLVGLEIKREFLTGELADRRSATLPVVAALGGMIAPALIYVALTRGTNVQGGWGIPMATDIAFALGALAILARRIPSPLRVFLAATAIVDDVGAVLVIALVYTPNIVPGALLAAGLAFLVLLGLNRAGVRRLTPYVIVGVILWVAVLKSGVHATIAGVLLAMAIPSRNRGPRVAPDLHERARESLAHPPLAPVSDHAMRQAQLLAAEKDLEDAEAPLARLEHALVPWVTFGIIPIFALANAGVRIEGSILDALSAPVSLGIVLGLVIGKQIGVLGFPWLATRIGIASLPLGVNWRHMWGAALLAGIGFTMSLFIAGLGLPAEELARAKLAILVASIIAATAGIAMLLSVPRAAPPPDATRDAAASR